MAGGASRGHVIVVAYQDGVGRFFRCYASEFLLLFVHFCALLYRRLFVGLFTYRVASGFFQDL